MSKKLAEFRTSGVGTETVFLAETETVLQTVYIFANNPQPTELRLFLQGEGENGRTVRLMEVIPVSLETLHWTGLAGLNVGDILGCVTNDVGITMWVTGE